MKTIVEKSGLSKGAFYHYFESKEALFHEIVDVFVLSHAENFCSNLPKDNLRSFVNAYIERITHFINQTMEEIGIVDSVKGLNYFTIMFDAFRIIPDFAKRVEILHKNESDAWVEVIKNARITGEINTFLSDMQVARLFINSGDGRGMHLILEGRLKDIASEFSSMYNTYLAILKCK